MAEEKAVKKNWFRSLFSDKEWDWDLSKITGFAIIVVGVVMAYKEKQLALAVMGFGAGLIGWKAAVEGV